jgi:hypothetical protein
MVEDDINFMVSDADRAPISRIADRAHAIGLKHRPKGAVRKTLEYMMDITAVHANGCPLDLYRLLAADDANFAHDVFGIERHLNRLTGQLENCFLPRFALKAQEPLPDDPPVIQKTIAAKREAFEARTGRKRGGGNSRRGRAARRKQKELAQ